MDLEIKNSDSDQIISQVCRTCLNVTTSYCTLKVDELNMITMCIPQINIELIQNPVMCRICMNQLSSYHIFLNSCIQSEEQLTNYCKNNNILIPMSSNDLVKMKIKSMISVKEEEDLLELSDTKIKIEKEILTQTNATKTPSSDEIQSFICEHCNKNFKSKRTLDCHKEKHKFDTTLITCEECEMIFTSKHAFNLHKSTHTRKSLSLKLFRCESCNKSFNRKSKLLSHEKKTHGCNTKIETEEHIKIENDEQRNILQGLPVITELNENLALAFSLENSMAESYTCEEGMQEYNSKQALDNHQECHTISNELFTCNKCEINFDTIFEYKKHLRKHKEKGRKLLSCSLCSKVFNRKCRLEKHKQTHKVERFRCKHNRCGRTFLTEELLNTHEQRIHINGKMLECTVCGNKYSTEKTLQFHLKSHDPNIKSSKPPEIMCSFCGKLYFRKSDLEIHVMNHTGERPFDCTQCGKKFKENYILEMHMRTHTGEKPFSCTVCDYKSSQRDRLRTHMRTHTGERPYPCSHCDKKFTRKHHAILHIRSAHTGERPFSCEICSDTFTRKDYLMKHKNVHRNRN